MSDSGTWTADKGGEVFEYDREVTAEEAARCAAFRRQLKAAGVWSLLHGWTRSLLERHDPEFGGTETSDPVITEQLTGAREYLEHLLEGTCLSCQGAPRQGDSKFCVWCRRSHCRTCARFIYDVDVVRRGASTHNPICRNCTA